MEAISRRQFIRSSACTIGAGYLLTTKCAKNQKQSEMSDRPNIIFLLTDDQRWKALGCAGNPIIKTPNMDFLAQNGVRFEKAFVTTPICAASRASLFTGLYERTHGYTFTKPPIAENYLYHSYPYLLRQAGYQTGFVGKFGVNVEKKLIREMFDSFKPSQYPYFKEIDGKKIHLTDINMDNAISFVRNVEKGQPFCLSVSTWAPHADDGAEEQYFWPEACDDLYRDVTIPEPGLSDPAFFEAMPEFAKESMNRIRWYWRFDTPEKYQKMVKGYYRMISGVDMALGRLMEELKKQNMDQNTVIILMGDNGYYLGERGFAGKWTMHDLSIRVPLIIYDPRRSEKDRGQVLQKMALNIDVTPTILDLAGVSIPEMYQGRSLLPIMRGDNTDWRSEILTEHLWDSNPDIPQTEAVRTEQWKYIRYPKHPDFEELYDLEADPNESNNLVGESRYHDKLRELRKKCDRKIQALAIN